MSKDSIPVLLLANVLTPLDQATDGMERSALELIRILANRPDLRLTVIAHPSTRLPPNVELAASSALECPSEYLLYGDGYSKWQHIANDHSILNTFLSIDFSGIVHDMSSSSSSCLAAFRRARPTVKTVRLIPSHPSCRLTRDCRSWSIYISHFQKQMDQWNTCIGKSVFYDYIPRTEPSPPRLTGRVISVGRIESRKGHDLASEVAVALGKTLSVIGRVMDHAYAETLTVGKNTNIIGELEHSAVVEEIRNSDALIWTPRTPEPGGRVVIEALKCGVPAYVFRKGLASDILDKEPDLLPSFTVDGQSVYRIQTIPPEMLVEPASIAERHVALYTKLLGA